MATLEKVHETELKILKEIDRICRKYHLTYMLDSGTLLGAVRHGGFIPWDDDADVAMKRADYEKFMKVADRELPDSMELIRPESFTRNQAFYDFTARIIYKKSRAHDDTFEMDFYEGKLNHIWVDIFTLDDLPQNPVNAKFTILLHDMIYGLAMGHRYELDFKKYGRFMGLGLRILSGMGKFIPLRFIFAAQRKIAIKDHVKYPEKYYYSNYQPDYLNVTLKSPWCDSVQDYRFEDTYLSGPADADAVLTHVYGDYMTLPPKESRHPTHSTVEILIDEDLDEDCYE